MNISKSSPQKKLSYQISLQNQRGSFDRRIMFSGPPLFQKELLKIPPTKHNPRKKKKIYIYIYMHAVELKIRPRFGGFWVENPSKVALKIRPRFFLLVFPSFIVFFAGQKTQIVCRGAKIVFWQFVRVSKKGFLKKMCTFCFRLFYVGKSKKDNTEKVEEENFKKKTEK